MSVEMKSPGQPTLAVRALEPKFQRYFLEEIERDLADILAIIVAPTDPPPEPRPACPPHVLRLLHGVKGKLALLKLNSLEQAVHLLEDDWIGASKKNEVVPVELSGFTQKLHHVQKQVRQKHDALPKESDSVISPEGSANFFEALDLLLQETAQQLDKQIVLELNGLDELVLPDAYRPLMRTACLQILRNSLVHGIETTAERRAFGKIEVGTLSLTCAESARGYEFIFSDDGRGLNPAKLREVARAKQLISSEDQLSNQELLQLIFLPGFSTVLEVNPYAGRGVGLDYIKNEVEHWQGIVEVESTQGAYSAVKIFLPKWPEGLGRASF